MGVSGAYMFLLTLYQTIKFMTQYKLKALADEKINVTQFETCCLKGRKHFWKRRKCWLPAFSPFLKMFSKVSFLNVIKRRDDVVSGQRRVGF